MDSHIDPRFMQVIEDTPELRIFSAGIRQIIESVEPVAGAISNESVRGVVLQYETSLSDDYVFEFHREHIDIQIMLKGRESIGWCSRTQIIETSPYDSDTDAGLGSAEEFTILNIDEGFGVVFFPNDAHAPGHSFENTKEEIIKLVIKVPYSKGHEQSLQRDPSPVVWKVLQDPQ